MDFAFIIGTEENLSIKERIFASAILTYHLKEQERKYNVDDIFNIIFNFNGRI